jgi:hypothetical protein
MGKIENIPKSIEALSPEEVARLRDWLDELDERLFDEKIERSFKEGKLDTIVDEVEANIAAGRFEPFE